MESRRNGKVKLLVVRHGETDCNVQGIIQGQLDTDLNSVGRKQAEYVGQALRHEPIDEVYSSPLRRAKDTADAIVRLHTGRMTNGMLAYWLDDRIKERGFGSLEGKTFDRRKPKRDSIDGIEKTVDFVARLRSFLEDVLTKAAPFSESDTSQDSEWVDEGAQTRPATVSRTTTQNGSHASTTQLPPQPPLLSPFQNTERQRTILLVAHGAAISALVGTFLLDMNLATVTAGIQRTRVWNCSITEITVDIPKLPLRNGRVDLQPLIDNQSRNAFIIERWADVRHLPDEIDDAVESKGNVDEMVGKET